MISSIVFINTKGQILVYRSFKDDVLRSDVQGYCSRVVATKQYRDNPILLLDGVSYISVPCKDLVLSATTKTNINCAMAIQFLYHLISICKEYFGGELRESEVKANLTLIYEILDEMIDYGCPQFTDACLLKKYIIQSAYQTQEKNLSKLKQFTSKVTGASPWRPDGIVHKKNDIYIDVVEEVNALFSSKGTVLRADVAGTVKLKCMLSGIPTCKLGMNDKLQLERESSRQGVIAENKGIAIDDMKFHQCVRLPKFNKERSITFIPPDGSFELMNYRVTQNVSLPFKVMPVYSQISENRMEIRVKIKSIFDANLNANYLFVRIPCPKTTAQVHTNTLLGRAKYEPDTSAIVWRMKKFQGDFECSLQCDVLLNSSLEENIWIKPPISLQFSIPMFTASGVQVRFFQVSSKQGYKPNKLYKTVSESKNYEHRL